MTTTSSHRGLLLLLAGSQFPFLFPSAHAQITGGPRNFYLSSGTVTLSRHSLEATNDRDTGYAYLTHQTLDHTGGILNLGTFDLGYGKSTPDQPTNNYGGIYTITAGTANIGDFNLGPSYNWVGYGYVNHNGGTVNVSGQLRVGRSTGIGHYNLNGGTLTAGSILLGSPQPSFGTTHFSLGTATLTTSGIGNESNNFTRYFNLNGGTLRAGSYDNTNWIAPSLQVAISNSVAIDTNGREMGILVNMANGNPAGSIIKRGAGTLTLGGANGYSGATTIEAGTLSVSASANLGAPSNSINFSGGNLRITGTTLQDLNGRVLNASNFNGGIDVAEASNVFTLSQSLSGFGALGKLGAGTLVLTSASTRSGATTLAGGQLRLADPLALQASPLTLSGGSLRFSQITSATLGGIAGTGTVLLGNESSAPVDLSVVVGSGTSNFDGSFSGPGSLAKLGPGTLVLGGVNSHGGATHVSAGTLVVSSDSNLGDPAAAFTLDGGGLRILGSSLSSFGSRPVNSSTFGGSMDIADANNTFTLDRPISGTGSLTKLGLGTLVLGVPNSSSGATNLNAGTLSVDDPDYLPSGNLNFNGGILRISGNSVSDLGARAINGTSFNGGFDIVMPESRFPFGTPLSGGGTLVKRGAGTLVLQSLVSGSPNFTHAGGALVQGGTLEVVNGNFTGPVAVAAGSTFALNSSGNGTTTGVISGAGGFRKLGDGNHVFSVINPYTGGTIVDAGKLTLTFGGAVSTLRGDLTINQGAIVSLITTNALGYDTGAKVDSVTVNGGTLSVPASSNGTDDQGWGIAYTLNGGLLSSNGGASSATASSKFAFGHPAGHPTTVKVTADSTIAGRVHLRNDFGVLNTNITVDPGATLLVGAAVTSGGGGTNVPGSPAGFTKLGGGTMRLEGPNTYTGDTVLAGGTLSLGHASALGTLGKVVFNGGTLQFTPANSNDSSARFSMIADQSFRFDTNGLAVNFGTPIASTGGSLTKFGNGSLKLSAANTYTGGTIVGQGTLELALGGSVGTIRGNLTVNSGATLHLTATDSTGFGTGTKVNSVTLNGGTIAVPASASATGNQGWGIAYTLNGGTLSSNGGVSSTSASSNFTLGGPTGGPSSVHVTADATMAGRVNLRTDNLNPSTDITVDAGATLLVTAGITSDNGTGTGGFRKLGAGSMTLNGNGIYTGATQVKLGLLEVNGNLGNTPVTISTGAALAGSGAVSGLTTVEGGGRLAYGTPIFANGLSLAADAVIDFKSTDEKWIKVTGGTLSGPTTGKIMVNLSGGASAGIFTIIDGDTATFSNLTAESFVISSSVPGYTFHIVQTGKKIQLTSAPVPSYDQWAESISDPAQRARTADPDGDGFTNLEEYLFGTPPELANGSLTDSEKTPEGLLIRWLQRTPGASYQLQESSDLSSPWPTSELPITDGNQDGVPADYTRKQALAPVTDGLKFFRIRGQED